LYCSPSPAKPTLLQYNRTTIAQYSTPLRPPLCMPCTMQYWPWQCRVKAKMPCLVTGFLSPGPTVLGSLRKSTAEKRCFNALFIGSSNLGQLREALRGALHRRAQRARGGGEARRHPEAALG